MKIKDYTIFEYLSMENRSHIEMYFEFIKPTNEIKGHKASFEDLTFNEVSVLKLMATKEDLDSLQIIIDIFYTFDKIKLFGVGYLSVYEVIGFKKWVAQELEKIIEREKQLEVIPDVKLLNAGIDSLNVFREFNAKKQIGEQFGFKPSEVGGWNYNEVYNIQLHNKLIYEIQKNGYSKNV